jgi:hypothetical protein
MANFVTPTLNNPLLVFNPTELRDRIIERLNKSQVFTDQNFQGSNISALIDIVGYTFGSLLFYLSKTSSESMFSDAQIYENMNRIVKLLNYNPIGKLTQNVPFSVTATDFIKKNTYVIPRYSFVNIGTTTFTLLEDLAFSKTTDNVEDIETISNTHLLHLGTIEEYPLYIATGLDSEIIHLGVDSSTQIDHFGIFVYVRPENGKWEQWKRVDNKGFYSTEDRIFEVRFNQNKKYEISFGDGINGFKLNPKDQVAIYYLKITPSDEAVGSGALNGSSFTSFNSIQYTEILSSTQTSFGTYLNVRQLNNLLISNQYPGTEMSPEESVESIRNNAPKAFRSQNRLITTLDYETYIKNNFKNYVISNKVVSNNDYLRGHLKYLYDIGLKEPHLDNQILFNQIKFANSCNFNNIYIYSVPKNDTEFLTSHQKEYLTKELNKYKTITSNLVPMDPEYMYFDFYLPLPKEELSLLNLSKTKLRIIKDINSRTSDSSIKFDVINILLKTFDRNSIELGKDINTFQLSTDILAVEGINRVEMVRNDTTLKLEEICFLVWNSRYPVNDMKTYTQTVRLEYFMYPKLYKASELADRIEVINPSNNFKNPEF